MKLLTIVSTSALLFGAASFTPAVAESFNDRGPDWTLLNSTSMSASQSRSQTRLPDRDLMSSSGREKTFMINPQSSSTGRASSEQACPLTPRIGFNESNSFPVC